VRGNGLYPRQPICAVYDDRTIRIERSESIAMKLPTQQSRVIHLFDPPLSESEQPRFNPISPGWMMCRSGGKIQDNGQIPSFTIDIVRESFEGLLYRDFLLDSSHLSSQKERPQILKVS